MTATSILRRCKPYLGTLVEVQVCADPYVSTASLEEAVEAAYYEIATVHRLMSFHDPASELSLLNRAPVGEWIELDVRTASVLRSAQVLSKLSGGVFDCAIADKLVALGLLPDLGFTAQTGVDDALRHTPALQFRGRRVAKRRVALFDLGGVAKGYAVDRATAVLRTHGVLAGLVNAGGDLRHFGREASLVRVRDPEHPTKIAGAVSLKDGALATSATRPLAGAPGPEISPIYDTSLNQPHPFGQGATVCAPSCLLADALTKVVLGAGPEAQALLERLGAQSVSFEAPA